MLASTFCSWTCKCRLRTASDLFEALADESPGAVPVVVFVTADDRQVGRALQIGAADYLLKPFSDERFEMALQRALRLVSASCRDDCMAATSKR